ncbi:hypothetical protein [Nocardiopsis lambiniae]|uniref:DUF11 domain-containing protein n=1 Tax=Nocardiopsis lambiniae TaxID=3075539 RepID=A0ABU2M816_9ACTN|nr:hypothetical protein [Nocardiopsis sp. DSM 44743]MDT0328749.1 hypothetical protein [Nocardiopsis sp. DSM 44743]
MMVNNEDDRRGRWRAAGVAALVGAGLLAVAPAALADPDRGRAEADPSAAAPGQEAFVGLSLVAEGGGTPLPGHEVVLRTTVANGDPEGEVRDAHLAQHVPDDLEVVEVDGEGVLAGGIVNWRVDVPAGGEQVYTVRVRVGEDTEGTERLMSTACLLLERDADPTACASDTVVVASPTVMSRMSEAMNGGTLARMAGVALLVGLGWAVWRRRVGTR